MKSPFCRSTPLARRALLAALLTAGTAAAIPAHADRGGRFRGGPGWGPAPRVWVSPHHHGGFNGWWIVGAPWVFYPPYYSPPPVVVQQEAPIVLPDLPPAPQSWYFCDSARAYYPYTQTCPEGWRSVPATPSGESQAAPPADVQNWYYCESAKGYYPYVQRCPEKWRPVPAQPQAAPQGATPAAPTTGPEGASKP
ncbi:hypothetical protein GCM10007933_27360 [Zoogloea oryzae]|uniref:Lipoprotein n=1 Tax=Zoogloea oryzae TaxID=310767 RepID=A0ABQ6FCH5_9RHOO|nr:hypothetical protein [Zoogloea oryzae]GLT23272.1 hypothetical protein GCM10007933_27360 [Zoogloea oryzae]